MGLEVFDLPVTLPPVPIGMAWHPRQSEDGGHAWLRSAVRRAISTEPVGDIGQRG
jgi:DNA-binding transcriptional LysR family regulator